MRAMDPASFLDQTRRRLERVEERLVTMPGQLFPLVRAMGESFRLVAAEELACGGHLAPASSGRDDVALVQFTSGPPSDPRGVILTHGDILANARSISRKVKVAPRDRVASWMLIYHDMGLIGFLVTAIYAGSSLLLMPPRREVPPVPRLARRHRGGEDGRAGRARGRGPPCSPLLACRRSRQGAKWKARLASAEDKEQRDG